MIPLRAVFIPVDQRVGTGRLPLLSVSQYHGVTERSEDNPSRAEDLSIYKVARRGDMVVNRMSAYQGALGVAPIDGVVSPDYLVLRLRKNHFARFWEYVLKTPFMVSEMASRVRGIGSIDSNSVRTPRLNFRELREMRALSYPWADQVAIADFLDRETAKIDVLIQKLTAMLDGAALRHALSIAEHLERAGLIDQGPRLKHYVWSVRQGWSPQCNNWPADEGSWAVLKAGCVNRGIFRPHENKELPSDLEPVPEHVVRRGEVLVNRANTRDLVGSAGVVDADYPGLMLCDKLYALTMCSTANPRFVALALGTSRYRDLIELKATGASYSMQNISQEVILNLPMSLPGRDDQDACVRRIDETVAAHEALVTRLDALRVRAQERRAALITAAVTGQLDIGGEA